MSKSLEHLRPFDPSTLSSRPPPPALEKLLLAPTRLLPQGRVDRRPLTEPRDDACERSFAPGLDEVLDERERVGVERSRRFAIQRPAESALEGRRGRRFAPGERSGEL